MDMKVQGDGQDLKLPSKCPLPCLCHKDSNGLSKRWHMHHALGETSCLLGKKMGSWSLWKRPTKESASETMMEELTHTTILLPTKKQCVVHMPAKEGSWMPAAMPGLRATLKEAFPSTYTQ